LLRKAANEPLKVIEPERQFISFVDASETAVGGVLAQNDDGGQLPLVAFASSKFTPSQHRWSTIEREAYAALWILQNYKHWTYGMHIVLMSDHNHLTFLVESTTKSSKINVLAVGVAGI
jgi:hypothetical protein